MNKEVQYSIDARKNAILSTYEIKDDKLKDEVNKLFDKINDFAKDIKDQTEFETKFATSPLNQEYIDLFTKIATSSPMVQQVVEESKQDQNIDNDLLDVATMEAESLTSPMRHQAYQATYDAARNIPIVGDIMTVQQHVDFAKQMTGGFNNEEGGEE